MSGPHDPNVLPPDLPVPMDDGATDHLGREPFLSWPPGLALPCTDGSSVELFLACTTPVVLFFYPRTGVPGQAPGRGFAGEEWEEIPGARGCTPQSCGFRDRYAEFVRMGIPVYGVSTNTTEHQREFKARQRIPFEFLSDSDLRLTRAMALPTFEFPVESGGPTTLIRRMAMFCDVGSILKVWYPVFPPDRCADMVLHWLRHSGARRTRATAAEELRAPRVAILEKRSLSRLPDRPATTRGTGAEVVEVRPIEPRDLTWVREELVRNWDATQISSLGRWYDADALPGFVATRRGGLERVGLLTHTVPERGGHCEVITLSSRVENAGVGTRLLDAAVQAAKAAGCTRVFLTTTNDNLRAIGFYQKRGWSLVAVHPGAMDRAREVKPTIPLVGMNGIPLRDEIELGRRLGP